MHFAAGASGAFRIQVSAATKATPGPLICSLLDQHLQPRVVIDRLRLRFLVDGEGRDITTLAAGTAAAQIIALLASPVLTRLYAPGDFGVFAVYTSTIGIVGSLASLSYHQAIPVPESDLEAANVFGLSLALIFATTCATVLAVLTVTSNSELPWAMSSVAPYVWLIPVGVFGLAVYEAINQWAVRRRAFLTVAGASATKGLAQTGTHLALGAAAAGPIGLMAGQLFGQWAGIVSLLRGTFIGSIGSWSGISLQGVTRAARRYLSFLRFNAPAILFNVAGRNTPPIILYFFFGLSIAGLFSLAERVIMLPVTLLAKNASQVFVASAAGFHREGRLAEEAERVFQRMLALGTAPSMILGIAAPSLFAVAFGAEWEQAGVFVQWLSAWLLFLFVSFALTPVVFVLERQKSSMVFQGAMAAARVLSLVAGGLYGNIILAVSLFGLVSAGLWGGYLVWLLVISGVEASNITRAFAQQIRRSGLFVLPVIICAILDASHVVTTAVAVACGLAFVSWLLLGRTRPGNGVGQ